MRNQLLIRLIFLSAISAPIKLSAQITDIEQFKIVTYYQSNATPPTVIDSCFFGNRLYSDPDFDISLPMVFTASTNGIEFVMNESGPEYYTYGGPNYATKEAFDADYPDGEFDYAVTYQDANSNNVADNVQLVTSTNDLYSTNLPAFNPDCWAAMQHVDPAQPFTLSWNSYTATPGTDYAETFIGSYDNITFDSSFGSFNFDCPPDQTSVTIPAGTLSYGRSYSFLLYFSNRQTPTLTNSDGSSLTSIMGFDNQTHANLITLSPLLTITQTNGGIVLTWAAFATNYTLQTTPSLPAADSDWDAVLDVPGNDGTNNVLVEPILGVSSYYRLEYIPD
jgi:hypothetical protein